MPFPGAATRRGHYSQLLSLPEPATAKPNLNPNLNLAIADLCLRSHKQLT